MSVWSSSTGRNSVFGAEVGPLGKTTKKQIQNYVHSHAHLHSSDGHCFHQNFHTCQHQLVFFNIAGKGVVGSLQLGSSFGGKDVAVR